MAGNKKKKRKKRTSVQRQPPRRQRKPRLNVAQMAFIAFGVIIILSMVISLVARF